MIGTAIGIIAFGLIYVTALEFFAMRSLKRRYRNFDSVPFPNLKPADGGEA